MSLEPGQTIDGKYKVLRRVGEGGMGTVYEGENVRIGRRVAIKVLHSHVAARPEFAARFEREARAAARIGSDHICDVLDLGDFATGERFIVMEYLDGESLEQRLTDVKKVPADTLLAIGFEILEALATMHEAGVIHRDLKPANVFLSKTQIGRGEVVKILDFGVSKFLPAPGESSDMTATGTLMGTPLYMSPEQARGQRDIDGRADVYAASVIFYRALTGALPFTAENFNELMFKIALEEPRPIRELAPEVDAELAAIVHRGLARLPEGRWASARAYQEALVAWARKQGRFSLSMLRVSASDKALAAAARKAEAPKESLELATSDARPASSRDGTPTSWSEDGPVPPVEASPDTERTAPTETLVIPTDQAPAPVVAAPAPAAGMPAVVAQTRASAGAPSSTPPDAQARSQAAIGAQGRSRVGAVLAVAAIVAVGAIGGVVWRSRRSANATANATATTSATATANGNASPTASESESPNAVTAPLETASAEPPATTGTTTARGVPRIARPPATITAATSVASAPAPPPVVSAAPSGSAKGRKFRTNLE